MQDVSQASADVSPGGWSSSFVMYALTGRQGRPAAVVVTVLLAILYVWLGESHWRPLRHAVFDRYQRAFPNRVDQWPVVIVDIDEASLAAIGQWPWPRTRLARLIEATRRLGARVVGLDIIMPEADRLSPQMVITDRPEISPGLKDALAQLPSNDTILAETLRRVPSVVVGGQLGYQRAFPNRVDRWPVVIVDIDEASLAAIGQWPWPRTRLARLIEATRRLGARVVGLDIIMPEADRLSPQMVITDRPLVIRL